MKISDNFQTNLRILESRTKAEKPATARKRIRTRLRREDFMKRGGDDLRIPSPTGALAPYPSSGKAKRTRPRRARLHFSDALRAWLGAEKGSGEIALSFPTTQKLQILALERFCGVRRAFPRGGHWKTAPQAICGASGAFNNGRHEQGQNIVAGERVVLLYKSTRMIRYRYKGIKV